MQSFDRRAIAAAVLVQLSSRSSSSSKIFSHLYVCVGRVCNIVLETRETREKTRTRIFGSGSGQVSLNKISGFSGQKWKTPKISGRVGFSGIFGFLHTLVSRKCPSHCPNHSLESYTNRPKALPGSKT